jgi:Coenzyme PQQ synthesis protein D (PqqD)
VPISNGSKITRSRGVSMTRTGDEAVLVNETSGQVHVVNGTAARIWELCEGDPTVGDLLGAMTREYQVGDDDLRSDVESLLRTFSGLQLLAVTSPS